jgi:hypothetical protein
MLWVFIHQAAFSLALIGLGTVLYSALFNGFTVNRPRKDDVTLIEQMGYCGFIGLFLLAIVGMSVHFFVRIHAAIPLVVSTCGLIMFFRFYKDYLREMRKADVIYFLLFLMFVSWMSSRNIIHGDTGLYHLQAVKWCTQSPIVYGLANLHGRFGFNSAWWVDAAMFEVPWLSGKSCFVINGTFATLFGLVMIGCLTRLVNRRAEGSDVMMILSVVLFYRQITYENNPSLSSDLPANLLILVSMNCLFKTLIRESKEKQLWIGLALIFSTLAATIKLFAMPLLAGIVLFAVYSSFISRAGGLAIKPDKRIILTIATCVIFAALWDLRGIVISGYPLYPVNLLPVKGLQWRVPESIINWDNQAIKLFARSRGLINLSPSEMWAAYLRGQNLGNIIFGLSLSIVCGYLAIYALLKKRDMKISPMPYAIALSISAFGLIFCLYYAPALRFASGYFFCFIGLSLGYILNKYSFNAWSPILGKTNLTALLLVAFVMGGGFKVFRKVPLWDLPKTPEAVHVVEERTKEGLKIFVPQGEYPFAWNSPIPSTPYFNPDLRAVVRDNGEIVQFYFAR